MFNINMIGDRNFEIVFLHLILPLNTHQNLSSEAIINFFVNATKINGNKKFEIAKVDKKIKCNFYYELHNIMNEFINNYNNQLTIN